MKAKYIFLTLLLRLAMCAPLHGSPIEWEIHQAFPSWVEGERWVVFAKITNVGDEVIPLAGHSSGSVMQQIRLVPKRKNGMQPPLNSHYSGTHLLPKVDQPWKSELDWREWPLHEFKDAMSSALMPGQSEVLGDLSLRQLDVYSLTMLDIESFQLALRMGPDRYILSESQTIVLDTNGKNLENHPIIEEIEVVGEFKVPIRKIQIESAEWLFFGGKRIARVPHGATAHFSTENEKQILVVDFDGVKEEPVRIDVRHAFPLSGSRFTVPHLHLWRSLTERSMFELSGTLGGFYKESGLTLEQALALKWDGTDLELKAKSSPKPIQRESTNGRQSSTDLAGESNESSEIPETNRHLMAWILFIGGGLVGILITILKIRKGKSDVMK